MDKVYNENFMHKKIGNNSYTHSIYTRTCIWNCDIDLKKKKLHKLI